MRIRSALVPVLPLAAVLLGGSTGCGLLPYDCGKSVRPDGITEADLVGDYTGKPFGELHLEADGTFTVTDWQDEVPSEYWGDTNARDREETLSREGYGEWELYDSSTTTGDIELVFHQLDGIREDGDGLSGREMKLGGSRSSPTLYQYLGDPDLCEFLKFTK
jgi:hypothetical protein